MRAHFSSSVGETATALGVVGEHVGQADERGLAVRVVGVVALDDRRDGLGQAPAAGEDAADQRVVDAELAALAVDALLRRAGVAVHLAGVAGVGVHQDELADVVQQRGDHQAVAMLVAGLVARRSAARWVATPCRRKRSGAASHTDERSKKSKVRARVASAWTASRREQLDGLDDRLDPAAGLALDLVAEAQARRSRARRRTRRRRRPRRSRRAPARTTRSRRLRDSASAGNASSASKAAVRRRPWPSLCRRADIGVGRRCWLRRLLHWRHVVGPWNSGTSGPFHTTGYRQHGRMIEHENSVLVRAVAFSSGHMRAHRGAPAMARRARAPRASRRCPARSVVPASATRIGWKTSLGFTPRASTTPRSAGSIARRPTGSTSRQGAARASAEQRRAPSSPSHFSRAFGSSAGPSKRKPASGQKSASVWIFSCEIATAVAQAGRGP